LVLSITPGPLKRAETNGTAEARKSTAGSLATFHDVGGIWTSTNAAPVRRGERIIFLVNSPVTLGELVLTWPTVDDRSSTSDALR
jgi:hypothetical protein